tara:strand:+ start:228 stop:440 length:213 start_codon:yes stop_codon:yes gene_type:complete
MKPLLIKIAIGVSALANIVVIILLAYTQLTYDKKVEDNRKWLKGEIKDEVVRQIRESMPNESGGVNVGNK